VLLSGQTARLTALSGDSRRQELRQQISKEMHENLSGLEQDLSKLKVQRDMAIAEMEEIASTKAYVLPPKYIIPALNIPNQVACGIVKLIIAHTFCSTG
jgi:hypothetical protein